MNHSPVHAQQPVRSPHPGGGGSRAESSFALGRAKFEAGDNAGAETELRQAIAAAPGNPAAHMLLGCALLAQGKHQDAADALQETLRLKADDANAHAVFGRTLAAMGRFDEAVRSYEKSLAIRPDHVDVLNDLGCLLVDRGKYVEGGEVFQRILIRDPGHGPTWNNLGNLFQRAGNLADAIECYGHATTALGDDGGIHINMASVCLEQAKIDLALAHLRVAAETRADDPTLYDMLANVLTDRGQFDEAIETYRHCLALDPARALAHINLANALEKRGIYGEALVHWERGLELVETARGPGVSEQFLTSTRLKAKLYRGETGGDDRIITLDSLDRISPDSGARVEVLNPHERVLWLRDASVHVNEWQILQGDRAFLNLVFHLSPLEQCLVPPIASRHGKAIRRAPGTEEVADGPLIALGGCTNYYHWMIDYLPRLRMIDALPELRDVPILVNADFCGFQRESLAAIGFDTRRLKIPPAKALIRCKTLIVPHFMDRPIEENLTPDFWQSTATLEIVAWLREKFLPAGAHDAGVGGKIFISRREAKFRRCVNEAEILAIAVAAGFHEVRLEKLSFARQAALFAGASTIVGTHGAGFTNVVFAPPGSRVIELHPENFLPRFFIRLAEILGHRHMALPGELVEIMRPLSREFSNFRLDPAAFAALIDASAT
ncbi:MAG: tetratricopeptide repeat protein [Rhodospirillales bacterium]|nr:tetratricopeptide repeat protein [Rhodospirillales bacterium]